MHISSRRYSVRTSSNTSVQNTSCDSTSKSGAIRTSATVDQRCIADDVTPDCRQASESEMPEEENIRFHKSIRRKWNALVMDRMSILAFSQQLKKPTSNRIKGKTKRVN